MRLSVRMLRKVQSECGLQLGLRTVNLHMHVQVLTVPMHATDMYNLNFPERAIQIQFECADLFTQVLMSTEVHKVSCRVSHTQCSSTKADTGIYTS